MLKKSVSYFLPFLLGVLLMESRTEFCPSCSVSPPAEIIRNVNKSFSRCIYLLIIAS